MPLPPTRYIDAGPGVPLASSSAAMAEWEAIARMGQTIQRVGEVGFRIADKVRRIDESRIGTSFFTTIEKEAADYELSLMKREDTDNWKPEYAEKSEQWKQRITDAKLSPEGRANLEERFAEWNVRKQIGFEAAAANKSVELARKTTANAYEFQMGNRNYDGARQAIDEASEWMDTPDREKALMQIDKTQRHEGILDTINGDARGWMEANPADKPPDDYDPAKWRQLHDYASGVSRDEDAAASDGVLNQVVTGNVTTREEIEKLTPKMTPLQRQKLYDASARWNAEGAKARREDPANISANVGKFYSALGDWKPDE